MLVEVETGRLRPFDRPDRADPGRAGEHDPPSPGLRQGCGIELRKRMGYGTRNMSRRKLVRFANVDEHEGAVGQAALDLLTVKIDNVAPIGRQGVRRLLLRVRILTGSVRLTRYVSRRLWFPAGSRRAGRWRPSLQGSARIGHIDGNRHPPSEPLHGDLDALADAGLLQRLGQVREPPHRLAV